MNSGPGPETASDGAPLTGEAFLAQPQKAIALFGMSGVGKTRLANRLAETIGSLNPEEIARVLVELERGAEAAEARLRARREARRSR